MLTLKVLRLGKKVYPVKIRSSYSDYSRYRSITMQEQVALKKQQNAVKHSRRICRTGQGKNMISIVCLSLVCFEGYITPEITGKLSKPQLLRGKF